MNIYKLSSLFLKLVTADRYLYNQFVPMINLLKKHKIIPIASSSQKKDYLGQGCFSTVFEVDYKGKRCVAKMSSEKGEFNNTLKLDQLKSNLGEYQKHFPIIYDYFIDQDQNGKTWEVLITEYLEPINSHVLDLLFGGCGMKNKLDPDFTGKYNYEPSNKRKELIISVFDTKIEQKIISILKEYFYDDNENIDQKIIDYLIKFAKIFVENFDFNKSDNYKLKFSEIYNYLKEYFKIKKNLNRHDILKFNNFFNIFFDKLCYTFSDAIYSIEFPKSYNDSIEEINIDFTKMPETKSLLECLLLLKEKGIFWHDLHSKNIMERSGTHDLVIIDPGLFSME